MKKKKKMLLIGILLLILSICLIIFDVILYNDYVSIMKKNIITATVINKECDSENMCVVTYKYKINKKEYEYTKEDKIPESNIEDKVKILGNEVYTGKVKLSKWNNMTLIYIGLCASISFVVSVILFFKSFKKKGE